MTMMYQPPLGPADWMLQEARAAERRQSIIRDASVNPNWLRDQLITLTILLVFLAALLIAFFFM